MTKVIGLTGGIATGKSTVAQTLATLGAQVIDADNLAHQILEPGQSAVAEVLSAFGPEVASDSGVNRIRLGEIVFADPKRRADLEAITHPRILALLNEQLETARQAQVPLVIADIPLLFEHNLESMVDGTLLVYTPKESQIKRLIAQRNYSLEDAERRLAAQLPIDEKLPRATWVIDNSGPIEETTHQVHRWFEQVMQLQAKP